MLQSRMQDNRSDRLDRAVEHLNKRFKRDEAAPIAAFMRSFYARVADIDLAEFSVESLYGAALSMWKFKAQRRPGEASIRVYNPRIEEHGWKATHTIVEIVNDDMPFLVDSVTNGLNQWGYTVHLVIHPVVSVERGGDGSRLAVLNDGTDTDRDGVITESLMHIQIDEQSDPEVLETIRNRLLLVLDDVRLSVADWRDMLGHLDEVIEHLRDKQYPHEPEEIEECRAFLEWMRDNHFTFLGCRDYSYGGDLANGEPDVAVVPGSGFGILRDPNRHVLAPVGSDGSVDLAPIVKQFIRRPELIMITKTSVRGTVHRPVHMDYVGIKRYDRDGTIVGERRFVGLFTSAAYNRTPRDIPLLRRKVAQTIARAGFSPTSHDGKALAHILETYPRDELFQIDVDTLSAIATGVLGLQERPQIRMFCRRDKFGRYFSLIIYVPRERFNTELRLAFDQVLMESLNGRISGCYTQVGDSPLARLHYIIGINAPGAPENVDYAAIEQRLITAARSWHDDLHDALIERWGEERGNRLAQRYASAFPAAYTESSSTDLALHDIATIEDISAQDHVALNLYRAIEDPDHFVRFKIYHPRTAVALSDCLPMLENMGLRVQGETPHRVRLDGDLDVWIQDFGMEMPGGQALDLAACKENFEEAFGQVWTGAVEDDGFNRLVLRAGLKSRQIAVLRACCKYLRQTGIAFSQAYMENTLSDNAAVAARLWHLFELRHAPLVEGDRTKAAEVVVAEIEAMLDGVESLDEDRILRRYLNLMQSMLRTNVFQHDAEGRPKPYMSFKFDSKLLAELPLPRPFREIFVYSPRVEAVHLRGGRVARGGLRWSDRREDFRTEVLGLMKAQMVKNAVIVPVGSKGGFVTKRLPVGGDRSAVMAEVVDCYRTFIRGMLDITDNLEGQTVLKPPQTVCYDDDDPYLVVAADKGTATFSDIANGVAAEYGYWLGDAFASGGAKGYDHKGMGITARGAWESVKRHFRELGRDIQSEEFTVIGIGDMSGDVFGNGMLLSRHIRLLAAFDHRNIFIDPDPDAATSFAERERIFGLPSSSWLDYDPALISEGGGIFDRKAKSVRLTPQIQALTGLEAESVTPLELMHALLKAPADLLWFGGIGTYVKSHSESHAEAGDRANDGLRVNGRDLRCLVIGEGGNLGVTQRGRIEFARAGGRLNTDAVDNSAGVDCSDHEVNIKILVDSVVAAGEMTGKQRDRLLAEMTDDVGDLVLRDNYLQTQALSVAERQGAGQLATQVRFMRGLEREGRLDREVEQLPNDEALQELGTSGQGLTRPELSVLMAYAKMTLYDDLLRSDLTEAQALEEVLVKYFPRQLRKQQSAAIQSHRLRGEIIATATANSIVNRVGFTFVHDMVRETGQGAGSIARSYVAARDLYGLPQIWNAIEALDNKVPAAVQTDMVLSLAELVSRVTLWLLRNCEQPLKITPILESFGPGVQALMTELPKLMSPDALSALEQRVSELTAQNVPEALARLVESTEALAAACDIVQVAAVAERPVIEVGQVYFSIGATLGLDRLRAQAEELGVDDHWQQAAIASIVDDLNSQQRALASVVLSRSEGADGAAAVQRWRQSNARGVERCREMLDEFDATGGLDVAKLALVNRYVRRLIVS